ncbi:DNA primase [Enhydrobacter aerosaccus]|uniref:DNA primase n=1 Tax=Enhydrobacter aerosaccus TaxID=225324 RepID=A0A1T4JN70_9HYPH|nr:DNA primase [Enhydrobacter aerosaccus]SJZ31598.1 DNA primase [Enhydrobacter aerosaccus]
MAFPPGFLDELRARLSLSDIVGRKVALKRRSGSEYAGLCPFHNEKTPSFTVNDKKGFFHCFGCGEHGDAVGFVMKTEGLTFPESVEKLAREVGLPVPRATPMERERAERVSTLQQVVEEAARWFQKQLRLPVGRQGLDYLRGRGLEDATIDDFRLGFAPDSRDGLLSALKREGVPLDKIVEAGLAIQPEDNRRDAYDRFRGRVMFTINDRRGRAIAFGGRVIGMGEPKYLNSPETPLFHKGANLYCLDRARVAATKDQPVIVAEGYMDVIALHVAGFTGAVAPLGTALTEGQLGELWKLADEPFLCFDGDNAGRRAAQRAALRALPLLRPGKSLRFVALPAAEDPDSLIRSHGREAIRRVLELARPLVDLVWDLEMEGQPGDTPERRASIQAALDKRVAEIADPVVRAHYQSEIRSRLGRAWRTERPAWQPGKRTGAGSKAGGGRPFRGPGAAMEVPVSAGTEARQASLDLDGYSRQIRMLLGALIERPAMLHVLNEEVSVLPTDKYPELARLQRGLLDALSLMPSGLDPAADDAAADSVPLEVQLITDHLQRNGLGRLAETARLKAREIFRTDPSDSEAWMAQWRRTAEHVMRRLSNMAEIEQLKAEFCRDPSEENAERLKAAVGRMGRETLQEAHEGSR